MQSRDKQNKYIEYILFDQKTLESKIKELSEWVNEEYKNSSSLIMVGLLKGSFPFLAQLIKNVNVECILDFMTVSSYAGTLASTGSVKIILDLANDIQNKDVLIVEDIIDSGITLYEIKKMLLNRKPKSFRILTLLDKPSHRKVDLAPDKFGFIAPDAFLVGFGLDYKEQLRNLPYIGVFDEKYL